jgi:phosphoribosylformylglycinamidine synthase
MSLKQAGSHLVLIGERYDELGGSLFYRELVHCLGKNVPVVRFENERAAIHLVIEAIDLDLLESCHDISSGGLITTLAEMSITTPRAVGMTIDVEPLGGSLRYDKKLFSESTGFVVEIAPLKLNAFLKLSEKRHVPCLRLGQVSSESVFVVRDGERCLMELPIIEMKARWDKGLEYSLA